jgi:Xaa-Pro aminopeptidase
VLDPKHNERLARVRAGLIENGADWLVVPASADFRWLCGSGPKPTKRLVALAVPRRGEPSCIVPRLEADQLAAECPGVRLVIWDEHEDPVSYLAETLELRRGPVVLAGDGLRVAPLLRLAAQGHCRPAAPLLESLRAVKDAFEIKLMEEAASNADRVMEQAADFMRPGMTEREVTQFIFDRFAALGDTDPWAIVASGPNSALPHHQSSKRQLREGEVVLLDLGACNHGYGSDITRTFVLGSPDPELARVYEVVNRARAAAIAASRDGELPETVDRAARAVIEDAGFGQFFTHRTGHGVGLEIHEQPYMVSGNRTPLRAGMVHSVEPGVYLPGRFGVRLEDLVVVESGRARRLNQAPLDPLPPRLRQ